MSRPYSVAERVIVALDVPGARRALELAGALRGEVGGFKVGLELFSGAGPEVVRELAASGVRVFLDLKLHDIPNTVAGACAALARLGVWMTTLHAFGGSGMIAAGVRAAREAAAEAGLPAPLLLAVTVLTSIDAACLDSELGVSRSPQEQVVSLARLAVGAGADGIVCSPLEAAAVRGALGPGFLIVTPGVRPSWAARGDQARVATPAEAFKAGADYVVVGRPVTAAGNPVEAARRLVREAEEGLDAL